jgi:hypothetical protein
VDFAPTEPLPPSKPPPLIHLAEASHADSTPGGGYLASTTTTGVVSQAGALSEAAPTAIAEHSNRFPIVGFSWTNLATTSE